MNADTYPYTYIYEYFAHTSYVNVHFVNITEKNKKKKQYFKIKNEEHKVKWKVCKKMKKPSWKSLFVKVFV